MKQKDRDDLEFSGAAPGQGKSAQPETELHPSPRSPLSVTGLAGEVPPLVGGGLGPGGHIGPYRLLSELGQGGMGRVFLAEQEEPLRRQVALKVIRTHLAEDRSRVRFAAEQQALARMSHPFVAQVFDAGTTDEGQPYFVMERVIGQRIDEYCDAQRLSVRERLSLFAKVCEGVQHAHQKGVIHRDLKPSNILITETETVPIPKIIDFGIAKAMDHPLVEGETFTGERVLGTRGYISPEAIQGHRDPDIRTDVYALGLVLYELLSGALPFPRDDTSLLRMLKRVGEEEAPALSARYRQLGSEERRRVAEFRASSDAELDGKLRGDLTWIVGRAVQRDLDQRYPSVGVLGGDVSRHLRHEPIEAGPLGTRYRLGKWMRRHRTAAVAGLVIVLSLCAGIVARTAEARRANREAERANEEAERATRAAATASRVTEFLIDVFEVNDLGPEQGGTVSARELLDRGAERIRGDLEDEPLIRAAVLDAVGSTYNALGLPNEGAALVAEGLALRRQHLGSVSEEAAESLRNLTMIRVEAGEFSEAAQSAEELVSIREQLSGPEDVRLAEALNQMAIVLHNLGRMEESVDWQLRAISLMDDHGLAETSDYSVGLNHLGSLYLDMGDHANAITTLERCLEARERLWGAQDDSVAQTLNNLGLVLFLEGRREEANRHLERALAIRRQALGPEHPNLCWGQRLVADGKIQDGALETAEQLLDQCLGNQETALGRRHPFTAMTLEIQAKLRSAQGRHIEAQELILEAIEIGVDSLPPTHQAHGYYLHTFAKVLRDAGQLESARSGFLRAREVMSANMGEDHPAVREIESDLEKLGG